MDTNAVSELVEEFSCLRVFDSLGSNCLHIIAGHTILANLNVVQKLLTIKQTHANIPLKMVDK